MFYSLAIGLYRRRISPYKGFKCASARYHGEQSCSNAIEAILNEYGPWRGWSLIRAQFARCRAASVALAQANDENPLPAGTSHEDRAEEEPGRDCWGRPRKRRRQRREPVRREDCGGTLVGGDCSPGYSTCDDLACGIEAGDLACASFDAAGEVFSNCEIGSCEFGACDFS